MSTEENKALVHRLFEEGMNRNQGSVVNELIASDYVNYDFPAPAPGRQGFKQIIDMFRSAFPDLHVTLEDEIAEGDKVATRGYFSGTHQGAFQGIAPTGKQIHVKYIDIWRIEDGQLVENWVQMDMLGLLQQLGAIPAPEHAQSSPR